MSYKQGAYAKKMLIWSADVGVPVCGAHQDFITSLTDENTYGKW